jgi:hypothetical protein
MIPQFLLPKKLRAGYIQVVLISSDNRERAGMFKTVDGAVVIGQQRYIVDESLMTRVGVFRVPTQYYLEGLTGPISLRERVTLELDATEEFLKMEAHVARDALASFSGGLLDDKRLMILLIALVAGFGFLYYNFDKQFKAQQEQLDSISISRSIESENVIGR